MKAKNNLSSAFAVVFALFFFALNSFALGYNISFTGSGASSSVESVVVENLTKGTTVTVPAGNILNLSDVPNAINDVSADANNVRLKNSNGTTTISFNASDAGNTDVSVFAIDGKKLVGLNKNVQVGENTFSLSLAKGVYTVQIVGNGFKYSTKFVNQTSTIVSNPTIEYIGAEQKTSTKPNRVKSEENTATTQMLYTSGDKLLYKGTSGNYTTIVGDAPTGSKTINFEFVACQDGSGNNYAVVKIETQIWMVENLKTTKLNDGTPIPNSGANAGVYTNAEWLALTSPARCWYGHESGAEPVGGNMLYNFYAVNSGKLAPIGWHIPTKADWETLAANVPKPNVIKLFDATCGGTNELGFKALQVGCRYTEGGGGWYAEGNNSSFWASDSFIEGRGWAFWVRSGSGTIDVGHSLYNYGFPVRLIKD
jgi:uncharacterized protein (TIGR02145 family)